MTWRTSKAFVVIVATLACAAALGSVVLAYPRIVPNQALGAEWQCMRTAFVVTTCAPRMQQATPAMETLRKEARHATRG